MATFRYDTRLAQAPDEVWAVLTDARTIPDWFPTVRAVREEDGVRFLTIDSGATLRAEVVTRDERLRRFQYRFVDGFPVPVEFHLGTLDVLDDGPGSRVVYSQQIEPEALAPHVGAAVRGGIEGITRYFGGPACG